MRLEYLYTPYMDPIRLGLAFITFSLKTYFGCFSVCAASRRSSFVFNVTCFLRRNLCDWIIHRSHIGVQWFNQGLQRKSFWDMVMICRYIPSPSENGFMEPKYLAEEVIIHPNHIWQGDWIPRDIIPGSSRYVRRLPFGGLCLVKGHTFYTLGRSRFDKLLLYITYCILMLVHMIKG